MAYDSNTGILTIDNTDTFDRQLDDVAKALGDYRVTELAGVACRDLGLLCTSPNVNRWSVRKPIYTPLSAVGMDTEAYLQSQMYGFTSFVANSKTERDYYSTYEWFTKIKALGNKANLWGDSLPNGGYYCLNQFNKYKHKQKSGIDLINSVMPIKEIKDNKTHQSLVNEVITMVGDEFDPGTFVNTAGEIFLSGQLTCKYTIDVYYPEDTNDPKIIFNGYLQLDEYPESGSSSTVVGQFKLDTTNKSIESEWVDDYGNTIYWAEFGHIIITMYFKWISHNTGGMTTISDIMYHVNQKSTMVSSGGITSGLILHIRTTAAFSSYSKSSTITDTSKAGLWFKEVSPFFQFDTTTIDGYISPLKVLFNAINGSTGDTQYSAAQNLLVILSIKLPQQTRVLICNPWVTTGSGSALNYWAGILSYEQIGISNPQDIQSVECLLCYGRASEICPNGYAELYSADPYVLFPERFGFAKVMIAG